LRDDGDDRRRGVQSAEVALAVLSALGDAPGPVGLNALAALVGLAPAKAHRYLVSLIAAGMAVQRVDGRYDLGPAAARLGMAAVARVDVVNRAADALPGLVAETGCTAMLSVWGPAGATVVRWEKASPQLITALGVGAVLPLCTSATGLAFLAWLPERLLAPRLAVEAPDLTGAALQARRAVLREGWITRASGSFIPGLSALAVPVLDLSDRAEAVVTLVSNRPDSLATGTPARDALARFQPWRSVPTAGPEGPDPRSGLGPVA
jgi:DNA-binding IclR family transcriptional regulator